MPRQTLRIATRKSPLALWQANYIGTALKRHWPDLNYELIPMLTSGDKFLKDKLQAVGGKGLFVKELEEAILAKQADLAVHSMKDVPAELPAGLTISAICQRDNPRDAMLSRNFSKIAELPAGSVVGTASLRRQSQLRAARPDLVFKTLRGNINTRMEKMENGEYDAIILAAAGLERMGMEDKIRELLDLDLMLPACAQGALGIECQLEDEELVSLLAPLNDSISAICVRAERHVNSRLGGNCHVPLAVYCNPEKDNQLLLRARVMSLDGKTMISDSQSGSVEEALLIADRCAEILLARGARQLLEA